jgi:hypothetical protein
MKTILPLPTTSFVRVKQDLIVSYQDSPTFSSDMSLSLEKRYVLILKFLFALSNRVLAQYGEDEDVSSESSDEGDEVLSVDMQDDEADKPAVVGDSTEDLDQLDACSSAVNKDCMDEAPVEMVNFMPRRLGTSSQDLDLLPADHIYRRCMSSAWWRLYRRAPVDSILRAQMYDSAVLEGIATSMAERDEEGEDMMSSYSSDSESSVDCHPIGLTAQARRYMAEEWWDEYDRSPLHSELRRYYKNTYWNAVYIATGRDHRDDDFADFSKVSDDDSAKVEEEPVRKKRKFTLAMR